MRFDFKRFFFVVGVLWMLILWMLFAVYGVIQFWDRHVTRWLAGTADFVGFCILAITVLWVLFIFKTLKEEMDEYDPEHVDIGTEYHEGLSIRNKSSDQGRVVANRQAVES